MFTSSNIRAVQCINFVSYLFQFSLFFLSNLYAPVKLPGVWIVL